MTEYKEQVPEVADGVLSQPDPVTCQSAQIAIALGKGTADIQPIRSRLLQLGKPGNPYTMGELLKGNLGHRYIFDDNACLSEMREWIKAGEYLITHGWFTESGHVIGLDGVAIDPVTMSYRFDVKDSWSEFDFGSFGYPGSATFYDGFYSSYGIFATCVKGRSYWDAATIYRNGELDSMLKGAWVHRILPR